MDVKDYCSGVQTELTAWKAKLYDVIVKAERLESREKERILGNIGDMKILMTDLETRIVQLQNECPSEWSAEKKDIDTASVDMRAKYEETMDYIGKASPVSIAG